MGPRMRFSPAASVLVGFCLFVGASRVSAAGVVGSGMPASCTEAALDAALTGGGSVTFNCGGGAVSIATTTMKTIAVTTTIDGGGLITIDASTLSMSSTNTFEVDPGVTLTVQNLAIANNPIFGDAAIGIANGGTVVALRTSVSGSSMGFGIFGDVGSTSTATDCTFDGNAQGIVTFGTAIVSGTTFFNNGTALRVESFAPPGAVTNSTFSDNVIGIVDFSTALKVTNCTVTGSTFVGVSAGPTLTNTIVAGNPGGNCSGSPITDNGHNLEDGTSCGFSAMGSLSNTPAKLDPGGLADNGGPTKTIALQVTSAAVDGGDEAVCAMTSGTAPVGNRDQRGFPRPGAGHANCSIGAYEFAFCPSPPTACTGGFSKGLFLVKESPMGKEKLIAKLIKGPALSQTDLGDPLSTGGTAYAVCIYDNAGKLAGTAVVNRAGDTTCSGGATPCWHAVGGAPPGGKGYRYKDKDLAADGVFLIQGKGGAMGKSKLLVKGRGPALPLPIAANLMTASSATVQLRGYGAPGLACWSITLSNVVKHGPAFFKVK